MMSNKNRPPPPPITIFDLDVNPPKALESFVLGLAMEFNEGLQASQVDKHLLEALIKMLNNELNSRDRILH